MTSWEEKRFFPIAAAGYVLNHGISEKRNLALAEACNTLNADYEIYKKKVAEEVAAKAAAYLIPKKIIVNGPATIVLWKDGTKTVVKKETGLHVGYLSRPGEDNFVYFGFLAALAKKIFGSNSHLKRVIKDTTGGSTK